MDVGKRRGMPRLCVQIYFALYTNRTSYFARARTPVPTQSKALSVVELVAELERDAASVVKVCPSESIGLIEQVSVIGDVGGR